MSNIISIIDHCSRIGARDADSNFSDIVCDDIATTMAACRARLEAYCRSNGFALTDDQRRAYNAAFEIRACELLNDMMRD